MQVLIMYYSKTGHTKALAEHIADGVKKVKNVTCVLKAADKVTKTDLLKSDAIIAGSPVYYGTMAAELKKVFETISPFRKKMSNKIVEPEKVLLEVIV